MSQEKCKKEIFAIELTNANIVHESTACKLRLFLNCGFFIFKAFTTCDHFVPRMAHAVSGHTGTVLKNETFTFSRHLYHVGVRKSVRQKESKHFNNIVVFHNATHVSKTLFLQFFDAVLDGDDVERLHETFV